MERRLLTVTLLKLIEVEKFHPSQITMLSPHGRDETKIRNQKYNDKKSIEN